MMTTISSRANQYVKQLRTLRNRRERDADGVFFAEGYRVLKAAFANGASFERLITCRERMTPEETELAEVLIDGGVADTDLSAWAFDSVSYREEEQSIGAVIRQQWEDLTPETRGARCWVYLHDIQHPGNLGTIIRCCDAIGGDGVVLSGNSTDPYHPVAVRGSLGAVFSQRIVRSNEVDFAAWATGGGYRIIGTSPDGAVDFREPDYASQPVIVIGGNERIGISPEQVALCNDIVRISMSGQVESLNLSIATALVLYEVQRQRAAK